jgi:hypothetical protein
MKGERLVEVLFKYVPVDIANKLLKRHREGSSFNLPSESLTDGCFQKRMGKVTSRIMS